MPKPDPIATSIRGDTLCLNLSNHPDIGEEGLTLRGGTALPLPKATPSLLAYLSGLPGVTVSPSTPSTPETK